MKLVIFAVALLWGALHLATLAQADVSESGYKRVLIIDSVMEGN